MPDPDLSQKSSVDPMGLQAECTYYDILRIFHTNVRTFIFACEQDCELNYFL